MEFIQILILAIVQGLTEFLPISSSAHLILAPRLLGWGDQGLAFDVAVHVGTLLAVVIYMRREVIQMTTDWSLSVIRRKQVGESELAWGVIIGTIPAGIAGLSLNNTVETYLRSPLVIAAATVLFGVLLWWFDHTARQQKNEHNLNIQGFIIIGLAQMLALIPGTSRSGITITAALALGLERTAAARISFLFSIPIILAAGALKTKDLLAQAGPVDWGSLVLGAVLSFASAYLCIHFFLRMLARMSMLPFVVYRILLGITLFYIFLPR